MKKILIIENVTSFSEEMLLFLQLKDYIVLQVSDKSHARETASFEKPDIILCSCSGNEEESFSLLESFQNEPLLTDIPFIFLTSRSDKKFLKKIDESQASACLVKPFQLEELETLLNSLLK